MQLQDHRPRRGANHRDLFKEAGEKRPPQPRADAGEAAQAPSAWCQKDINVPSDGDTVNEEKVAQATRWDGIAWGNDQNRTAQYPAVAIERSTNSRSEDPTDLSLDKPAHPSPYRHLFHGLLLCAAHESPAPSARTSGESGIDATRTEPPAGQHSGKPPRRPQIRDAEQRVGASQTDLSLREPQVEHHTV